MTGSPPLGLRLISACLKLIRDPDYRIYMEAISWGVEVPLCAPADFMSNALSKATSQYFLQVLQGVSGG